MCRHIPSYVIRELLCSLNNNGITALQEIMWLYSWIQFAKNKSHKALIQKHVGYDIKVWSTKSKITSDSFTTVTDNDKGLY